MSCLLFVFVCFGHCLRDPRLVLNSLVIEHDLEVFPILPPPPECWDYSCVLPHPVCVLWDSTKDLYPGLVRAGEHYQRATPPALTCYCRGRRGMQCDEPGKDGKQSYSGWELAQWEKFLLHKHEDSGSIHKTCTTGRYGGTCLSSQHPETETRRSLEPSGMSAQSNW